MEKMTLPILSTFMDGPNSRESERRSDTVQVPLSVSHPSVSPLPFYLSVIPFLCARCGGPAGADSLWGGGVGV